MKDNLFSLNLYNKSYFEAARRMKKRSLLGVNEHFSDKADAKRALLDRLFIRESVFTFPLNPPLTKGDLFADTLIFAYAQ
ncbi:MAG: hypothetical protein IJB03_05250 [Alistipes sp.]|nr:hypothetical protein [Alistipes sp.]